MINTLPRVTAGVLAILYTSFLSLDQYGLYGVLMSLSALLGISIEFGIPQAILRNYFEVHRSKEEVQLFLSSAVFGSALLSICALPVLGILLSVFLDTSGHGRLLFIPLLLAIAFFDRICLVQGTIFRAIEKPLLFSAGNFVQASITILSAFILVCVFHGALAGALMAVLFGRVCAAAVFEFVLTKERLIVPFKLRWIDLRTCLKYGFPLIPNRFALWGRQLALRPLLAYLVPLSALGLFSFASAIAALPLIATSALDLALSPVYFRMRADHTDKFRQKTTALANVMAASFFAAWMFLVLFCPEIIVVLAGKKYVGAVPCCALLLCAGYVSAQQQFFVRQVLFLKKTWIVSAVGLPSAALSICATYFLAGRFGICAAAWSVVGAEAVLFVGLALSVMQFEELHYPLLGVMLLLCVLVAVAVFVGFGAPAIATWGQLAVKCAVGTVVSVVAYFIGIKPNRQFINAIARGRAAPVP